MAAGLDLEMPPRGTGSVAPLLAALDDGRLSEETLDLAVSRILTTHDRLRAARSELPRPDFEAHHALARQAASAGSVLLTNDGILPLDPDGQGTIAVVGELARTPRYQGAGSSHINPTRLDVALDAISRATERPVTFEAGYRLDGERDEELLAAATRSAQEAAVVVLFVGLPDAAESEGFDREHLDLPEAQLALIEALTSLDVPVVVVLSNGAVVDLGPVADASAILEMWLGGQASGSAAADLLFGTSEPGGRLAETIPLRLSDTPAYLNWPGSDHVVLHGERVYIGYRWYDARELEVRFPFGHGLGYTTFAYSDLEVVVPDPQTAQATVRATITNTGERDGTEVVQLYLAPHSSRVDRPVRELRGFDKVGVPAGESRTVEFELGERDFAYWGEQGWTADPGEYTIAVGPSSRSLPLTETISLDVELKRAPLTGESTINEWLADPVGSDLMRQMLAAMSEGSPVPATDEVFKIAGSMPLQTFVGFGGGDPDEVVEPLTKALHSAATPEFPEDLASRYVQP